MRKQFLLLFLFFVINIVLSKKNQRNDVDNNLEIVSDNIERDETGQVEVGKDETEIIETEKNETGKVDIGQGDINRDQEGETGQGEKVQDTTDKDETGPVETGKNDTEQDTGIKEETNKDEKDKDSTSQDNSNKKESVKSKVDSLYGSVEIEYVPITPEDKTKLNLIIYFTSLLGILVLLCFIHSIVYIRPKIIEKRNAKKREQLIAKEKKQLDKMRNSSSSVLDNNNNFGMEQLEEAKLKDERSLTDPSIDFNAASTDCIINVDKESSRRKKQ
ncbi:hypothetical protein BCR36DRAFT_330820 [Piromyces finnis]|uniref:Uncharacterized protein n=1 Tax=Piromyces finnis TaxID=1754191 RepID=A0A1Y1V620_9FUNG|nr:hypothetical protein BCR36DRAFT_330820 [Piromyces finnis]|eukprot:ORX47384.1 hypothetical protein BCR36DRAFT_330820 [Piromyces finnis]